MAAGHSMATRTAIVRVSGRAPASPPSLAARDTARGRGTGPPAIVPVRRGAVSEAEGPIQGTGRAAPAGAGGGADSLDFAGKHGLIVGVANKRSIAWAIAQATARSGARLALTYQERFEEHVKDLSQDLGEAPLVVPCDVTSDSEIEAAFAKADQEFGGLDFVVHGAAFAPREELTSPFVKTTRDGFRVALDISAYSLIALSRAAVPLMEKRGGGSILTLTYLGSERVFPNYNVMGVAKAALEATVRYLAADLGPKNIRVNAVSAGPIKTLASAGIAGFSSILNVYRERAPLRRNVEAGEVAAAAAFLLSDAGRGITGEVLMVDSGFHITGT